MYRPVRCLQTAGIALWVVVGFLLASSGLAQAQAQIVHSKNQGVAACIGGGATASINNAIDQQAGDAAIAQIAQQGHCFNLDPTVPFSVVRTIHVDGPNGGTDQVIGEVKLQNGTRSRFYLNADDVDPTPSNNAADYADPRPAAPADFGTQPFDPSKIPPPAQ